MESIFDTVVPGPKSDITIRQLLDPEVRFNRGFQKVAFDLLQRASAHVDDPEWQKEYRNLSLLA